ncbi:MAG: HDOD domain-containing protein [Pseudomonadota bacterium]
MRRIMFVDDEPNILSGLKRMLRPMRREWSMQFAESADEALAMMQETGVDVIVTDMRMPGHDGAWLLQQVKEQHPAAARIILSGHAEQEATIRSVAATHQFLAKPCDADTLRETVARTCQLREMLRSERLRKMTAEISRLPSLPDIYSELNAEMGRAGSSMATIAHIVERDLGMSAKILQLVNSAFFGLRRRVGSVAQAVAYLGMDVIRALVLSESAFKAFESSASCVDAAAMIRDSRNVAAIAKKIADMESDNKSVVDEAFQAGMMHQLGTLILASELPDEYQQVLAAVRSGEALASAEVNQFEVSHGEVGAYLLGLWGLLDGTIEAVAYHSTPTATEVTQFAPIAALHAAVGLHAQMLGREEVVIDEDWLATIGCHDRLSVWRDLAHSQMNQKDAA